MVASGLARRWKGATWVLSQQRENPPSLPGVRPASHPDGPVQESAERSSQHFARPVNSSGFPVSSDNPAPPPELAPCSDADLEVTNGPLQSASTLRHVIVSFTNTSPQACTLVSYPGADLATPAGGVLTNVPRRPANAAPRLVLEPGDTATAEVQAYAIDSSTGNACARWGNVVVTPPNGFVSHSLTVNLPNFRASISPVD